ncbi:MAG: pseudouridine synthase [Chitinophagaceae bacterium]
MSQQPFKKFVVKKNNAAIKEKFKQEKKQVKKERAEAINKRFEEKRALKKQGYSPAVQVPDQAKHDKRQKYPQQTTSNKQQAKTNRQQYKPPEKHLTSNIVHQTFAEMPLNKFIAHCGVGSRREAVPLIKDGKITLNGNVITEPGFKVTDKDVVMFNGKKLFVTKNRVYILLNKPKDYITTTDDPQGRKTVLQLIKNATSERIYPIGRLDRNTSGVLLFTNDGELTQRLTHPSYNIKKVYEVKLDKPVTKAHFDKIVNGINLDDGEIHADALAYADSNDKAIIGIEIHSGRNRIVRRIFEYFGYDVKALDRVMYAGLTKKNVDRGKWRYLSEKEIRLLKYSAPSRLVPNSKEKEKFYPKLKVFTF